MGKHLVYFANHLTQGNGDHTKIGHTSNLYSRKNTMNTSFSVYSIQFWMLVLCKDLEEEIKIEELLHSEFFDNSTIYLDEYENSGTEWFNRKFTHGDIEKVLRDNGHDNKIITDKSKIKEIQDEYDKERLNVVSEYKKKMIEAKSGRNNLTKRCFAEVENMIQIYNPTELQEPIVKNIFTYFKENDKGRLILPPGVGKTLISLFSSKEIKVNKICIGIPSLPLVSQWRDEIHKIYPNIPILGICTNTYNEKWITLNPNKIKNFLENNETCIVIVLYSSCSKLLDVTGKISYIFDYKVGDECHHLTGEYSGENIKKYTKFHDIKSNKSLFMTGTSKYIENNTNELMCSMDDKKYFGEIIDERNIKWAIENKSICDYKIILLKNTDEEIEMIARRYNINIESNTINLFLSAFMTLKSLIHYDCITHVFCYTNNIQAAGKVNKYISILIEKQVFKIDTDDIYHKSLNSESLNSDDKINIKDEIDLFTEKKYGIISCVYMFGEGFNLPPLNGVVFAENMNSEIRIIQSLTRCMRKDKNNDDKEGHIIIPFLDVDEWEHDGESFQKVRNIMHHIRNNDSNIEQKIKLSIYKMREPQSPTTGRRNSHIDDFIDYEEDGSYLKKLRLRMRKSTSGNKKTLLEEDYEYIRERNSSLNLRSKSEYYKSHDKADFIPEPEDKYKLIWKGWYHFLNYDTKRFISAKEEWISECKKNNINSLNEYYGLCDINDRFPIDASEFYECACISVELNFKNNKRRR